MALYMRIKWAPGGDFDGIDPRNKGLKGVVLGFVFETIEGIIDPHGKVGKAPGLTESRGQRFREQIATCAFSGVPDTSQ